MQKELVCLGARASQRALRVVTRAIGLPLRFGLHLGRIGSGEPRLLERGVELGLEQRSLERTMQLREVCARAREDGRVEAETLGDRERVRRTGQANTKPERRPQRVCVEFHARVPHTRCVQRECLELRVVRRRGDKHATLEERFEHRHREGRAFVGIGPRADLIEEREISALGIREGRDDVAKMR